MRTAMTTATIIITVMRMSTTITTTDAMTTPRVELQAPDIEPYGASNTGTPFVHRIDSGKPGPAVLIVALTHGNEICGAIAVDRLLRMGVRPTRGTLTLAFANVAAFGRFDAQNPYTSRFVDEDFNRLWRAEVLDGPRDSVELRRARELRPFVEAADYLLDIHSMLEASPPVMICGPLEKGIRFAFDVGIPEHVVSDTGHANGTRMRDFGGFGDPASPRNALLVECGQHWEKSAADIAWQTVWRFLRAVGVADETEAAREIAPTRSQKLIRVTEAVVANSPAFRFAKSFTGLEVIAREGDVIAWDGEQPVRAPYDNCVLVMPVPNNIKTGLTAVRLGRLETPVT
jgi:predicted deacylase